MTVNLLRKEEVKDLAILLSKALHRPALIGAIAQGHKKRKSS